MKKLMVVILVTLLALGLSVGVASAWNPPPGSAWSVETTGFSYGNFTAGGTVFGASEGYLNGLANTGYMVEAGVSIVAGLADPGTFELVSFGGTDYAQTRLIPFSCGPCGPEGTYAKTIDAYQHLQETQIVTGDNLVTTEMYSSIRMTDYPEIRMLQKVGDTPRRFPPYVGNDETGQIIEGYGSGPGYASMWTNQNGAVYGLVGAEIAGGEWGFFGYQIVDYTPDGGDLYGWVDLWGEWDT